MPRNDRIAILGTFGTGKSTISNAWCDLVGGTKIGFSTELKWEVARALAINDSIPLAIIKERIAVGIDTPQAALIYVNWLTERTEYHFKRMQDVATKDEYRTILQVWATEHRRGQDKWYWAKRGAAEIAVTRGPMAIEDCRYPEEYKVLRDLDFTFVYLEPGPTTRDQGDRQNHDSELHWPSFLVDAHLSFEKGPTRQAQRLIDEFGLDGSDANATGDSVDSDQGGNRAFIH